MSAALKKMEGVESVEISLERGIVDIRLKADNKVTLPQLRRTIRSNGNETKDAQVTARGSVNERDGRPVLDLLNGSTIELETRPDPLPAGVVDVTGVSKENGRDAERMKVTAIQ